MSKRPIHVRTDLMDTSDWAHRKMVELLREMTPGQRLARMFDLIESTRQLQQAARKAPKRE